MREVRRKEDWRVRSKETNGAAAPHSLGGILNWGHVPATTAAHAPVVLERQKQVRCLTVEVK